MAQADRESLTRQIRDAVDLVELVGSYVPLRRAGAGFKALCPFHDEKTPSFTVHPARQTFKCFGCGAGGDVFSFVQMKERVDFVEARRILAERAGVSLDQEVTRGTGGGPGKSDLTKANQWAQTVFRRQYQSSAGQAVRDYVEKRGITAETADAFGLGLAVDSFDSLLRQADQARIEPRLLLAAGLVKESPRGGYYDTFRNRLMFPIGDIVGRIVGFGGRAMGDDPAKYLNTPATALFDKGTNLFGLDQARHAVAERKRVVVVEGYTDCLMAHQHGFAETVATLGTAMTDAHAGLLRRHCDRVILLFDSDEAGERAAERALAVSIAGGLDVALARVPEGKDPCDYLLSAGAEGFESVLNSAVSALRFRWEQVSRSYNASATGPERRRALEAYLQQLSSWLGGGAIDPIQTGLVLNQLSGILSLPVEELHRQLRRMTRRSGARSPSSSGGPGAGQEPAAGRPADAEQEALRQIVEVLLNAPEHYPEVAQAFDPAAIRDPALATVARELVAMLTGDEAFRLDELIGRLESPEFGRLVTDLQWRGEHRGGYADLIEQAVACLRTFEGSRRTAALAEGIRTRRRQAGQGSGRVEVPSDEDAQLRALTASARNAHFSSPRARRRFTER